jgi:hypothetical protein
MNPETTNPRRLRNYLLGDLRDADHEAIEEWLMTANEAHDEIAAAEDDLIDDYLGNRLTATERDKFESLFLAVPERVRKLNFARAFHDFVERQSAAVPQSVAAPSRRKNWSFGQSAWAISAVAAALVLGAGLWMFRQTRDIEARLTETVQQRDQLQQELSELRSSLDSLQAQARTESSVRETLQQELDRLQSRLTPAAILVAELLPGISRSSTQMKSLRLSQDNNRVEFRLSLPDDIYKSYGVTLSDEAGRQLWTSPNLSTRESAAFLSANVPTVLLSPGDYAFAVAGKNDSGALEPLHTYPFRVVR